jgi:hypothetical protein
VDVAVAFVSSSKYRIRQVVLIKGETVIERDRNFVSSENTDRSVLCSHLQQYESRRRELLYRGK